MRLRTANNNFRRAHRARVLKEAFDFDMKQGAKPKYSNSEKRKNTYFARKQRKQGKEYRI